MILDEIRVACAEVARRAHSVTICEDAIGSYAAALPPVAAPPPDPSAHVLYGPRAERAAFFLTLDAINFGSGWFPTLRKRPGRSGYFTVAMGLRERFAAHGPWTPEELAAIEAAEVARVLGQDPDHELMALFAAALRDLGDRVRDWLGLVDGAGGSAARLVATLSSWPSFADTSRYQELRVPFLKRAQIAAADLHLAGVTAFGDLDRLTMFADNLVPHVLRLDGVLSFTPALVARIERGELVPHDSRAEVEIRACALQAVELLHGARPELAPQAIDRILWNRGQEPRAKAIMRHRTRCTAY